MNNEVTDYTAFDKSEFIGKINYSMSSKVVHNSVSTGKDQFVSAIAMESLQVLVT